MAVRNLDDAARVQPDPYDAGDQCEVKPLPLPIEPDVDEHVATLHSGRRQGNSSAPSALLPFSLHAIGRRRSPMLF